MVPACFGDPESETAHRCSDRSPDDAQIVHASTGSHQESDQACQVYPQLDSLETNSECLQTTKAGKYGFGERLLHNGVYGWLIVKPFQGVFVLNGTYPRVRRYRGDPGLRS